MSARDLCIMACVFCRDPQFHRWLEALATQAGVTGSVFTETSAKEFILLMCNVASRNELDTSPAAARLFHTLVREPFIEWKEAQHAV